MVLTVARAIQLLVTLENQDGFQQQNFKLTRLTWRKWSSSGMDRNNFSAILKANGALFLVALPHLRRQAAMNSLTNPTYKEEDLPLSARSSSQLTGGKEWAKVSVRLVAA